MKRSVILFLTIYMQSMASSALILYAGDNPLPTTNDYDSEVIGIGRVSGSDTHTESQAGGITLLENGTTLSDGDYLLTGL